MYGPAAHTIALYRPCGPIMQAIRPYGPLLGPRALGIGLRALWALNKALRALYSPMCKPCGLTLAYKAIGPYGPSIAFSLGPAALSMG